MHGLVGAFALMPLQDLVEFLSRRKASGSLTCERGTVHKTVHFVEGVCVSASSNDPREFLGQLLLNFGHIDEEQLTKAFETQQETKVRLGRVLAMVGVVSPEVIRETLALKIRETLLDVFLWDSGVFRVDDAPAPPTDDLDVRVPLGDIAREAEFRATAWQAFRANFPSGTAGLVVHEERVPSDLVPGSVDDRMLRLAREGKSIDEIGLALHSTDFHLYQRLYAFRRAGVVEARVTPHAVEAPDDVSVANAALHEARAALEAGRLADAEAKASRAVELAPGVEGGSAVVAEARKRLGAWLRQELLDPPRTPRLLVPAHDVALMRLPATDKYLLARCDGSRDLRQIVQLAPLDELEVLKAMKRFVVSRMVELKG